MQWVKSPREGVGLKQAQVITKEMVPKDVEELLNAVRRGVLDKAEQLLMFENDLVYAQGDIVHPPRIRANTHAQPGVRMFSQVTAFQYAIWALDKPMWELILKYLPKDQAVLQLQALEQDREDIINANGVHFNFDDILTKMTYHLENYATDVKEKFGKIPPKSNKNERAGYERKVDRYISDRDSNLINNVAIAQGDFPAWLITMMFEKGSNVAWVKKDVMMIVKRNVKHIKAYYWGMSSVFLRGRGRQVRRCCIHEGVMIEWRNGNHNIPSSTLNKCLAHDENILRTLKSTRLQELATLKDQLYADAASPSNVIKGPGY